jgi:hypothetical protein
MNINIFISRKFILRLKVLLLAWDRRMGIERNLFGLTLTLATSTLPTKKPEYLPYQSLTLSQPLHLY